MRRNVSLDDISDGRLYEANDMVKAGCGGCEGCSACCENMGESIVLDPLDVHRLTGGIGMNMEQLLQDKLELNVVDYVILPNIRMQEANQSCGFLSEEGRCKVHNFRPGICRLFPLGRYYENGGFKYFLQTNQCKKDNLMKVKVRKWIDTPQLREYEKFVTDWHYFLNDIENMVKQSEEELQKKINMLVLQVFYMVPYDENVDFYPQFYKRLTTIKEQLNL